MYLTESNNTESFVFANIKRPESLVNGYSCKLWLLSYNGEYTTERATIEESVALNFSQTDLWKKSSFTVLSVLFAMPTEISGSQ